MLFEGFFYGGDGNLFTVAVPVHHTVKAHADVRKDVAAQGNVGMQGAGGADPEDIQAAVHGLHLAGFKVHVGQGVQLRHHDVDIVRADAVGQRRDAFSVVFAGDGDKLTGGVAALDVGEEIGQHVHAAGVSHHDDVVGQLFGLQMNMESGAVSVNNEL